MIFFVISIESPNRDSDSLRLTNNSMSLLSIIHCQKTVTIFMQLADLMHSSGFIYMGKPQIQNILSINSNVIVNELYKIF